MALNTLGTFNTPGVTANGFDGFGRSPKPSKAQLKFAQTRLDKIAIQTDDEKNAAWTTMWEKYEKILNKFYTIDELVRDNVDVGLTCTPIKIEGHNSYAASGDKKNVQICSSDDVTNTKYYAHAQYEKGIFIAEVEYHLSLLELYYTTDHIYNWNFVIPKVYKRNAKEYVMDFVSIKPDTLRNGKKYDELEVKLQYDIGYFMGLYMKNYNNLMYDFEVYKDNKGNALGVFAAARDITAQKQLAEREVAEREKELQRIEELERFRKLTVGRELKMMELKKEIEELKSKVPSINK